MAYMGDVEGERKIFHRPLLTADYPESEETWCNQDLQTTPPTMLPSFAFSMCISVATGRDTTEERRNTPSMVSQNSEQQHDVKCMQEKLTSVKITNLAVD